MAPYIPPYISPKERAENRARWIRFGYRTAAAMLLTVLVMLFGYSDQAPGWLHEITVNLDALFGFPVLGLIKLVAA
jgi:hypothetical protein